MTRQVLGEPPRPWWGWAPSCSALFAAELQGALKSGCEEQRGRLLEAISSKGGGVDLIGQVAKKKNTRTTGFEPRSSAYGAMALGKKIWTKIRLSFLCC